MPMGRDLGRWRGERETTKMQKKKQDRRRRELRKGEKLTIGSKHRCGPVEAVRAIRRELVKEAALAFAFRCTPCAH